MIDPNGYTKLTPFNPFTTHSEIEVLKQRITWLENKVKALEQMKTPIFGPVPFNTFKPPSHCWHYKIDGKWLDCEEEK